MSININENRVRNFKIGETEHKVFVSEKRIMPDALNTFIGNVQTLGADPDVIKSVYDKLPIYVKSHASKIVFPILLGGGALTAMDNNTGDYLPFGSFSRSSKGTYFDKNGILLTANSNVPRVDFEYYNSNPKILIEKNSTNLCRHSGTYNNETGIVAGLYPQDRLSATIVDDNKFGKRIDISTESGATRFAQVPLDDTGDYTFSIFVNTPKRQDTTRTIRSSIYGLSKNGVDVLRIFKDTNPDLNQWYRMIHTGDISDHQYDIQHIYTNQNPTESTKFALWQLEKGSEATSQIPTSSATVTRTADLLSYTLDKDCSIYLKTTKQNVILDKPAGVWNIHEDLNNEGIEWIAIFDKVLTDDEKEKLNVNQNFINEFELTSSNIGVYNYKDLTLLTDSGVTHRNFVLKKDIEDCKSIEIKIEDFVWTTNKYFRLTFGELTSNYYVSFTGFGSTTIELVRTTPGAFTTQSSFNIPNFEIHIGDTLRVDRRGSIFKVYVNNVYLGSLETLNTIPKPIKGGLAFRAIGDNYKAKDIKIIDNDHKYMHISVDDTSQYSKDYNN